MLEADQSLGRKPVMLQLLATTYPGSEALKTQCFGTIHSDDGTWEATRKCRLPQPFWRGTNSEGISTS